MSRKCSLNAKKAVLSGHNVSHSNIKSKTKFRPNLQNFTLISDILGEEVSFRATPSTIRSVEHNNGLDLYLMSMSDKNLSLEARRIKKRIKRATLIQA